MKKINLLFVTLLSIICSLLFVSCELFDKGETVVSVEGIPLDDEAGETPVISNNTIIIPDFSGTIEKDNNSGFFTISINLTGVSDGGTGYLELRGTGEDDQNVWLDFHQTPKGILVEKISSTTRVKNDIVFLVDNSGSMSDEADGIAESIQEWANELNDAGIDAQFACVGYNDYGTISGAIDFTDVTSISEYLDRYTGVSRTKGFDTTELSTMASDSEYTSATGECGVVALRYANDLFSFREGSNRVYVNFTDEPNQTAGQANNSVEYVLSSDWTGKGTIHTVYSSTSCSTSSSYNEDPRLLSEYTGGTSMTVSSNFSGVTLSSLSVSDALLNSYIVTFTNIEDFVGTGLFYDVKVVIKDSSTSVQSSKTLSMEL